MKRWIFLTLVAGTLAGCEATSTVDAKSTLDPKRWADARVDYAQRGGHKAMYVNLDDYSINTVANHASTTDAITAARASCEGASAHSRSDPRRCVLAYLDDNQVTDVAGAPASANRKKDAQMEDAEFWSTMAQMETMRLMNMMSR